MSSVRFVMVGGFLGAGKTTTARPPGPRLHGPRPARSALVTNDQAHDLVDTNSLPRRRASRRGGARRVLLLPVRRTRRAGSASLEAGRAARRHPRRAGRQLHRPRGDRRAAAEGPVRRAASRSPPTRSCSSRATGCGSCATRRPAASRPKAAYIFRKQLEEADAIVINRIDELTPAAVGGTQPAGRRSSSPARRCCACRRRPGRGSTR